MRWAHDSRGSVAVEFALVAPTFLLFLFLLLDGSRLLFVKQALNEVAMATARCAALKASGCTDQSTAQSWGVSRAGRISGRILAGATVVVSPSTTCNGQSGMAQATVSIDYKKGSLNLMPQSATLSTISSSYCFPVAA